MGSQYQRGAKFERRVLKYLIGDNTSPTHGYLHTLLPANTSKLTPPLLYGIRSAGSRGDNDLLIIITGRKGQRVLGIQCKISKPGEKAMHSDMLRIKRDTGLDCVYAWRKKSGRKLFFTPELEPVFKQLVEEVC